MDNVYILNNNEIPSQLKEIPEPPKKLYVKGKMPDKEKILLCVVGARKHSKYGEEICKKLISELKGYNICIVSGLAIGIDGIAHRAAMDAGLQTIAFPGSGLDANVLYPAIHARLAEEIIYTGGALISEFEMNTIGAPWTFPRRNRLMAGISKATLVIEAELESGTLITSRLAIEYNRDVGAIPGSILSSLSAGPHMLIRNGAIPITCSDDILEMLGFERRNGPKRYEDGSYENNIQESLFSNLNENEKKIIDLLKIESLTIEEIIFKSKLSANQANEVLSLLEINGLIEEVNSAFKLK